MQQARDSGAVNVLRYGRFCGQRGHPGVPRRSKGVRVGSHGRAWVGPGGPMGARGAPGDSWDPIYEEIL